jgi:hypothetical protein
LVGISIPAIRFVEPMVEVDPMVEVEPPAEVEPMPEAEPPASAAACPAEAKATMNAISVPAILLLEIPLLRPRKPPVPAPLNPMLRPP